MKRLMGMAIGVGVLMVLVAGCGKKEKASPAASGGAETSKQSQPTFTGSDLKQTVDAEAEKLKAQAEAAKKAAEEQAAALKARAEAEAAKIAEEAARLKAEAEAKVQAAKAKFETMVANIKQMIQAKDYQAALADIQKGVALPNLTGEQKTTLQNLMEIVKKAMATDAAKQAAGKLGNALKGFGK